MRLLGLHSQSIELIRSLAITCHALDVAAQALFVSGTYNNKSPSTKEVHDELFSSSLLHLAVAIRTNLYQGRLELRPGRYIGHCGMLDVHARGMTRTHPFSIKDVCDKIIHADEIERDIETPEYARTVLVMNGKHNGASWQFFLSIELFCESVLNWLDEAEPSSTCADQPSP